MFRIPVVILMRFQLRHGAVWRRSLAAALLLAPSTICLAAADATRAELAERIHQLSARVARSPAERVTVIGSDRIENLKLMRWDESCVDCVAQVTGLAFNSALRDLRVTVTDEAAGLPAARLEQRQEDGRIVQRIRLNGYPAAYGDAGRLAFLRAVLAVYLARAQATPAALDAPDWLIGGFEQNLDSGDRAAAIETVLAAWEAGHLEPIGALVDGVPSLPRVAEVSRPAVVRAWQGALVCWLGTPQGKSERFARLFARLAAAEPVTAAWLFDTMPSGTATDLDELWDRWLLHQRGVVHRVGTVSLRMLDRLRAELLLYPGSCAIPLHVGVGRIGRLEDAIRMRDEPWIAAFAQDKIVRLNMLGSGRAAAFQDVVRSYDKVLRGLLDGESAVRLRQRLSTAESTFALLRDQVKRAGGLLEEERP